MHRPGVKPSQGARELTALIEGPLMRLTDEEMQRVEQSLKAVFGIYG